MFAEGVAVRDAWSEMSGVLAGEIVLGCTVCGVPGGLEGLTALRFFFPPRQREILGTGDGTDGVDGADEPPTSGGEVDGVAEGWSGD